MHGPRLVRAVCRAKVACGPALLLAVAAAQPAVLPDSDGPTTALLVIDADGDGALDLVTVGEGLPAHLLLARDGSFVRTDGITTRDLPARDVAAVDADGDGALDVVIACVDEPCLLLRNMGRGTFLDVSSRLPTGKSWWSSLAVADVDGDGLGDIAVGDLLGGFVLLRNRGGDKGFVAVEHKDRHRTSDLAWADVDGDGAADLVRAIRPASSGRGGQGRAARNDGDGALTDVTADWMPAVEDVTTALVLADVDGDGHVDLLTAATGARKGEPGRSRLHRFGDGRFLGWSSKRFDLPMSQAHALAVGDLDGDGDLDVVLATEGAELVALNQGDGHFVRGTDLSSGRADDTRALALADLDGDGDLDVVAGNYDGPDLVYWNSGAGAFSAAVTGAGGDADVPEAPAAKRPDLRKLAGGKYAPRTAGDGALAGAVRRALAAADEFFARNQMRDGRFDTDAFAAGVDGDGPCDGAHDVGVTALVALARMAAGAWPAAEGAGGDETLTRALRWLVRQQGEGGSLCAHGPHNAIYDHALGTAALCEAYGMTGDADLRQAAQAALDHLEARRNPDGGWRYVPRDDPSDTSVTVMAALAQVAGTDFGLEVPALAAARTRAFLVAMTDPETGRCGYDARGGLSARRLPIQDRFPPDRTEALTAAAMVARLALGDDPADHADLRRGLSRLEGAMPHAVGYADYYYWYYGAHALAQLGGLEWDEWRAALVDVLLRAQRSDGERTGSWDPTGPWGEDGGRFCATALAVLALRAEVRYARFVDRDWRRRVR